MTLTETLSLMLRVLILATFFVFLPGAARCAASDFRRRCSAWLQSWDGTVASRATINLNHPMV